MRKRKSREARIIEIAQIAKTRFKRSGLAETTLDMIAEDVGLPRPHLYRFFKSKSELVSAVIASEVAEINEQRWAQVRRLRSLEKQVVRSLELAVELIDGDEFWSTLITPGNVPHTAYAAASDPKILAANTVYWTKILESADRRGELRAGMDHDRVINWLLGIQFMFMERREIFASVKEVGLYARDFVVPALTR